MPKYSRKLRRTRRSRRGGDENYVVPKQVMPANENEAVRPLLAARASLQPASLRILKPKQQSVSEVDSRRSSLSTTPKSSMVYGMARRRKTRRHRK